MTDYELLALSKMVRRQPCQEARVLADEFIERGDRLTAALLLLWSDDDHEEERQWAGGRFLLEVKADNVFPVRYYDTNRDEDGPLYRLGLSWVYDSCVLPAPLWVDHKLNPTDSIPFRVRRRMIDAALAAAEVIRKRP